MDKTTPVNRDTADKVYSHLQNHHSSRCLLCLSHSKAGLICNECANDLPKPQKRCAICGEKTANISNCSKCLKNASALSKTIIACEYRYPANRLVQEGKYHRNLLACHFMGELLAAAVLVSDTRVMPDKIIPVPLHHKRQRERGYNQAEEIGRAAAAALNCVCEGSLALRVKATTSQTKLDKSMRASNVSQAFVLKTQLTNKSVAIVDDVMTTGSTILELARECRAAGAREVQSWVFARRDLGV